MEPRRSLRIAQSKKKPSGKLVTRTEFQNAAAKTFQTTRQEDGEFETGLGTLRYRPAYLKGLNSSYKSQPEYWDNMFTDSFDTDNFNEPEDDYNEDLFDVQDPENFEIEYPAGTVYNLFYRMNCLTPNNIHFRHPSDPLPDVVAACFRQIAGAMHDTSESTPDIAASAIYKLETLCEAYESTIVDFFRKYVFHETRTKGLAQLAGAPIVRRLLPQVPTAPLPVAQPKPDLVYGYSSTDATFTPAQHRTLTQLHDQIPFYAMAARNFLLPFFSVEFKASSGDLWVAANQCAGTSAACIQIINQLNTVLDQLGCNGKIVNVCYSFAVDNHVAQLYAAWKDEDTPAVYIQRVESFLFADPQHFASFYQRAADILEWGRGARLRDIRLALDFILEARQDRL